jgi:hypothetical protein
LITDNDYNILLSSDCAEKIDREIMQMAKSSPVMLSNGKRLSSAKIKGGYVLWLDDLSELIEVNDKLAEAKDDPTSAPDATNENAFCHANQNFDPSINF